MLVLSRRLDERLVMDLGDGRQVWVTVCDIRRSEMAADGPRVRLGVEAPQSVTVHREEVWNRIIAGV